MAPDGTYVDIDLPLDIILNIISRLPVNIIIRCKFLSKDFVNLIGDPRFETIYQSNKANDYFYCLFVNESKPIFSLDLVQFPKDVYDNNKNRNYKISRRLSCFNSNRLPQGTDFHKFSIFGYCNGLFCLLKIESGLFNLFVINPILGEFIQLPLPVRCDLTKMFYMSYGLGYCQFTNKFKVLRIFSSFSQVSFLPNICQIFTIGSDQNWRAVKDHNVPYNFEYEHKSINPQTDMVAFGSALHWIVQPVTMGDGITAKPSWGGTRYICAFDMTDERVSALPFPPEVAPHVFYGQVIILLDKLCLWRYIPNGEIIDLWVMNEYGVEGSWSKQFIFKMSSLPKDIHKRRFKPVMPVTISPGGLLVATDCHKLMFYDLKKKKLLKVIHQTDHVSYPIPFVPNFVSPKTLLSD
ncbi:hypothetical protein LIER_27254 [Lithospermum erythrorhizon]|uniref:F-box domain-containing protein n=1 Tax=Lithospermum erythrorhizon TaxID=34254 RepID=A0AAV3RBD6_LITER